MLQLLPLIRAAISARLVKMPVGVMPSELLPILALKVIDSAEIGNPQPIF